MIAPCLVWHPSFLLLFYQKNKGERKAKYGIYGTKDIDRAYIAIKKVTYDVIQKGKKVTRKVIYRVLGYLFSLFQAQTIDLKCS